MNNTIINTNSGFIADKTQVQNLASSLFVACQMQQGNHLALLIGNGDETNNQDAVKTWVQNKLPELEGMPLNVAFETLFYDLLTELESWGPMV